MPQEHLDLHLCPCRGTCGSGPGRAVRTLEERGQARKTRGTSPSISVPSTCSCPEARVPRTRLAFFGIAQTWPAVRKEPNTQGRATRSPNCQLPQVLMGKRQAINKLNSHIRRASFPFSSLPAASWCPRPSAGTHCSPPHV